MIFGGCRCPFLGMAMRAAKREEAAKEEEGYDYDGGGAAFPGRAFSAIGMPAASNALFLRDEVAVSRTARWGHNRPSLAASMGPRTSRLPPRNLSPATPSNFWLGRELLHVDQADQERLAALALAVVEQFIDKALAAPAPVGQHVFQLHQPVQMHAHLEVGPAGELAARPAG